MTRSRKQKQWIRLDVEYHTSRTFRGAPWQAHVVWPAVLRIAMRRSTLEGWVHADDMNPDEVAFYCGNAPVETVTTGMVWLKTSGLLTAEDGDDGSGFIVRGWEQYQNPATLRKRRERSRNVTDNHGQGVTGGDRDEHAVDVTVDVEDKKERERVDPVASMIAAPLGVHTPANSDTIEDTVKVWRSKYPTVALAALIGELVDRADTDGKMRGWEAQAQQGNVGGILAYFSGAVRSASAKAGASNLPDAATATIESTADAVAEAYKRIKECGQFYQPNFNFDRTKLLARIERVFEHWRGNALILEIVTDEYFNENYPRYPRFKERFAELWEAGQ